MCEIGFIVSFARIVAVSDLIPRSEAPFVKRGENAPELGRALAACLCECEFMEGLPFHWFMFIEIAGFARAATWLILPVVICLSQRLSHACLSINCFIL